MTRPEAVVFDLGNVLIRWDPMPALVAGVGSAEATAFLGAEDFDFMAWNHVQDTGRSWADAESEVAGTHPHWERHARAYRANFPLSLTGVIEENVAVLRDLHGAGVPVFALTNWSTELFPVALSAYDFLALFDDIVVSADELLAKPDPRIFDVLAARTGLSNRACVFVDDKAENVEAARSAGLDGIVFTEDGDPLRPQLAARGLPV